MKYVYYMTHRPPMPGAQPKDGLIEAEAYDYLVYVKEIGRKAYGKLTYDRELTEDEIRDYELTEPLHRVPLFSSESRKQSLFKTMLAMEQDGYRYRGADALDILSDLGLKWDYLDWKEKNSIS